MGYAKEKQGFVHIILFVSPKIDFFPLPINQIELSISYDNKPYF